MTPQKTSLAIIATIVLLVFAAGLQADTRGAASHFSVGAVIGPHGGFGVWIGKPAVVPPPCPPPVHREVVMGGPWRHRFVRLGPPCREPVVVAHPPAARPIVIHPAPPIQDSEVVVWITNSNGSKTSVKLTRRGTWYIGPRGEYYDQMPTNEQLRTVYGF